MLDIMMMMIFILIKQNNASSILDPVSITVLKSINHCIPSQIRHLLTNCIPTNTIQAYFKQTSLTPKMNKSNIDIN